MRRIGRGVSVLMRCYAKRFVAGRRRHLPMGPVPSCRGLHARMTCGDVVSARKRRGVGWRSNVGTSKMGSCDDNKKLSLLRKLRGSDSRMVKIRMSRCPRRNQPS